MQPNQLQLFATYIRTNKLFLNTIAVDASTDGLTKDVTENFNNQAKGETQNDRDKFEFRDKFMFRNNLIYISEGPCRLRIMKECHDDALVGHFGIVKTLELIS